ncbi:hypothetical protein DL98DRAFT_69503 [Cadophora sp. DSE1049]|nr:hypothetical protein DL98DRAFT_69503 [Cadophora sp. DSE1049]
MCQKLNTTTLRTNGSPESVNDKSRTLPKHLARLKPLFSFALGLLLSLSSDFPLLSTALHTTIITIKAIERAAAATNHSRPADHPLTRQTRPKPYRTCMPFRREGLKADTPVLTDRPRSSQKSPTPLPEGGDARLKAPRIDVGNQRKA